MTMVNGLRCSQKWKRQKANDEGSRLALVPGTGEPKIEDDVERPKSI